MWFFSLLFTLEVNWAARYMAVSRNVHVGEILCVSRPVNSGGLERVHVAGDHCRVFLPIDAFRLRRLGHGPTLARVRYLYSPKEVRRFFKLAACP